MLTVIADIDTYTLYSALLFSIHTLQFNNEFNITKLIFVKMDREDSEPLFLYQSKREMFKHTHTNRNFG